MLPTTIIRQLSTDSVRPRTTEDRIEAGSPSPRNTARFFPALVSSSIPPTVDSTHPSHPQPPHNRSSAWPPSFQLARTMSSSDVISNSGFSRRSRSSRRRGAGVGSLGDAEVKSRTNLDQDYDEKMSSHQNERGERRDSGCQGDECAQERGESIMGVAGQSSDDAERTMGLGSAILMVIGTLIGTGIFASPGPLFDVMHCPQTAFIIWAVAGITCLIGAYAYAELGTMFPESGGDFQYLRHAFGKKVALVFGWSFIIVLNPIGTAGIAGVLGRYSVDMITYFETGNSVGLGAGGDGGKRVPNGGQVEIGPHHTKLLDRFKSRHPLNKSMTAATNNTAMIAKRFLEAGETAASMGHESTSGVASGGASGSTSENDAGNDDGNDDGDDEYYFYEMDDDDMRLYDRFARQSFWIPDSSQSQELQQGLVQKSQDDGNQLPNASPSFPKAPLPSNHTSVVPPKSGMGPDGKPLLPTLHADDMPIKVRLFSIAAIVIMGLINICFKEGGKWASNVLAIFKIAGMVSLIGIGTAHAIKTHNQSDTLMIPMRQCSHNVLDYVSALCYAFFAFNGFNNINLGLGELRNPERNLKRAVLFALPLVTALFLLANFSFFSILSSYDLRHVHSLSLHAGHTVLGQPGGFLMAGTVVAAALGSINSNIWAGSRLLVILAKDDTVIPSFFANVWSRRGTVALALSALVFQASVHAMLNLDFKTFSKIYSAVGWGWYGLSIAGLLYMRKLMPQIPRPVRIWWPFALVFVMIAFFLVGGALTLAFMSVGYSTSSGGSANGHMPQVNRMTRRDVNSISGGGGVNSKNLGDADENDDDEGEGDLDGTMQGGGGRFVPLIMFAAVGGLMLLIIPAYYGTRALRIRRERRTSKREAQAEALVADAEGTVEALAGDCRDSHHHDECTDGDSSDSYCDSSSSSDEDLGEADPGLNEKYSQDSEYCEKLQQVYPHPEPVLGPLALQERTYDNSRRDSSASSVTLVDETTGKRLHRSSRRHHHRHHHHRPHNRQPRRQHSGSLSQKPSHEDDFSYDTRKESIVEHADEGEEMELARIKSLRTASLEYLCQQSLDTSQLEEVDDNSESTRRTGRQLSPMTVLGDLDVIGTRGGSSRNGSTSGSNSVPVAAETEVLDPFSTSSVFVPSGPEHPFDHRPSRQPPLFVPGTEFCLSPLSSPSPQQVRPSGQQLDKNLQTRSFSPIALPAPLLPTGSRILTPPSPSLVNINERLASRPSETTLAEEERGEEQRQIHRQQSS